MNKSSDNPEPAEVPGSDEAQAAPGRFGSIPWLSLSAFLLSLTIATINAYYALRGPEIVVQPLEEMLFYRDGEGDNAVAVAGVKLKFINTASSEYGDLLLDASLTLEPGGATYPIQSSIEPVFTTEQPECQLGSRCHYLDNLLIVENDIDMLDLPGGNARSAFVAFAITPPVCTGDGDACAELKDFGAAAAHLSSSPREVVVHLKFNGDGERDLHCKLPRLDEAFLGTYFWQSIACSEASVSGGGLL